MVILHCAEHVYIAQTQSRVCTPYFCEGQESESESVSESVSVNVNESLGSIHMEEREHQKQGCFLGN